MHNKKLYVVLRKDDPNPIHPWLPPDYPSRCTEAYRQDHDDPTKTIPCDPPLAKHKMMTALGVEALQTRHRKGYLAGRHHAGYDAKDPNQVVIAHQEHMTPEEQATLNNLALGAFVAREGEHMDAHVLAAYNRMQRIKRGEERLTPTIDDLQMRIAELEKALSQAREDAFQALRARSEPTEDEDDGSSP